MTMLTKEKFRILWLIVANFGIGLTTIADFILIGNLSVLTYNSQYLVFWVLATITFILSGFLFFAVGYVDYRVCKFGLEKGFSLKTKKEIG